MYMKWGRRKGLGKGGGKSRKGSASTNLVATQLGMYISLPPPPYSTHENQFVLSVPHIQLQPLRHVGWVSVYAMLADYSLEYILH